MLKRSLIALALLLSLASEAPAASGLIILPDVNGNALNYGTITSSISCPTGQTPPCVVNNSTTAIVDGVAGAFAAGVTAPSTVPLASQPALIVTISPNSPAQAVTVSSGTVTASQGGAPWSQNITQIAGSSIATAATGIAKVGLTDGAGTAITSTGAALDVNVKTSAASNISTNEAQINGVAPAMGNGTTSTGTQRVTLSSDSTGQVSALQGTSPWVTNITQFGSSNVATGTGAGGAGIPRVTISNDSSLAANQSANVNQFGGSAVVTGTGAGGSGIPRVTVSNDSTLASKDFLNDPGTSGFTQAAFSVLTTELNALASAGVATSSVNGSSGVFSQTNSGNNIFGRCWVKLGAALGGAATANANFSVWYLTSTDGGTTFESQTVSPPPRSADLVIPVGANAYGANAVLMSLPRVFLWSESVKMVFQNNTGQAMGASGNVMTCAGEATKY